MAGFANTYATSFPLSENPISEGGRWLNGGTCTGCGAAWNNIKTTGGYAQQAALGNTGTDDGTAVLTGSWGATQTVMIRGKNPTSLGGTQELEARLRTTVAPNSITGYEIDFLPGGTAIVRWNGAAGDFTIIGHYTYDWTAHTNPILKATISGSTINVYDCSTDCSTPLSLSSGTNVDSTYTTGNPGIGIDVTIATTGSTDFGITNFIASDEGGIFNAATCDRSNVNAVINGATHTAVNADIIYMPPGSCTWTSGIIIPSGIGIQIIGSGTTDSHNPSTQGSTTTITDNFTSAPSWLFYFTPTQGNATTRISSFNISPQSGLSANALSSPFAFNGTCTSSGCPNIRLDHIVFPASPGWGGLATPSGTVVVANNVYGVLDHNSLYLSDASANYYEFVNFNHSSWLGVGAWGDNSWFKPDSYGQNSALYVETNYFENTSTGINIFPITESEGSINNGDLEGGGRVVCRFNIGVGLRSMCVNHGTESNTRPRGGRQMEFYKNSMSCNAAGTSCANNGMSFGPGPRSGSLLALENTYTGKAMNSFAGFAEYRATGNIGGTFDACDGAGRWDHNDGVTYYTGKITGVSGSNPYTLTIANNDSSDPGWTAGVTWVSNGSPYSIHDVTISNGWEISTNTGTNTLVTTSGFGSMAFAVNDSIQILRASACIDQPSRIGGTLLSGNPPTPTNSSGGYVYQTLDPIYQAADTNNIADPTFGGVSGNTARIIANRDFYAEVSQTAQTSATSPFNGTVGTGYGTLARRPTSCTAGVGYWAQNVGNFNQSGSGGQGTLYTCITANNWYPFFTPNIYPHPLVTASTDVTAPVAGNSGTITTASVTNTTLTLNWTKATDAVSAQANLVYEVCQSLSAISTIITCEENLINSFLQDIATANIVNLTAGTTYHFNVVVMDEAGNKTLYTDKSQATSGSCDHLLFTGQPSNALVGAVLGIVVVGVYDTMGNFCGSDTSTITITNKAGTCTGMTLGGTTSGANQLTTTTLTENAAGLCALHATDGSLTAADSNAFTITAPTASTAGRVRIRK